VDIVGNTAEGIININYKAIMEVLIEVYFKVITRRNAMFVKS
jgi:hypothetical protein